MNIDERHFDYYIRYNDYGLWIIVPSVRQELFDITKFSFRELEFLKELYTKHGEKKRGMNFDNFNFFVKELYGLSYHPLAEILFNFFDKEKDGILDFKEIVLGMNVVYKGDLHSKSYFAFWCYDFNGDDELNTSELNELFLKCYIDPLDKLQIIYSKIFDMKNKNIDFKLET